MQKQRRQLRNRLSPAYNLHGMRRVQGREEGGEKGGKKKRTKKKRTPRVKYKFSMAFQMVFGHQMQMRSLQLANLQLPCQKTCQQLDTTSSPFHFFCRIHQKKIMGKGTAAVPLVKVLQAVISLNSIYPWENKTSTN